MSVTGNNPGNRVWLHIRLTAGVAAVGAWWGLLHLPIRSDGSIAGIGDICLFHRWTGLPCPFCGMTRSLLCFFQGNWLNALRWHPLGVLLGVIIMASFLVWMIGATHLFALAAKHLPITGQASGTLLIVMVCGAWLLRLAGIFPLPPSP